MGILSGYLPSTESQNHRIIEIEGAYKAIESSSLLNAGIQGKADLTHGCILFCHYAGGSAEIMQQV